MRKPMIYFLVCVVVISASLAVLMAYVSLNIQDNVIASANGQVMAPVMAAASSQTERYIPFQFYAFSEPDFNSDVVGLFSPQYVTVLERYGAWLGISGRQGLIWVYPREIYILERITGLFEEPFGEDYYYIISPQILFVQERYYDWVQIRTFAGLKWIYSNFSPSIAPLQEIATRFESAISIFYKNLETGFTFSNNGDRVYFAASVTKAPFALYIYKLAEQGLTSLNMPIAFTEADYWGGSGVIRHRYNFGQTFTQERVLGLNLYESDNIATRMLRRVHGVNGYRDFIESIGGNPNFVHNITYSHISAYEAGLWAYNIFQYIESDGQYAHIFREQLLNNQFKFQRASYPIASKTGWTLHSFGGAWHDMSIIYAPSPYILVILSNSYQRQAFLEISDVFERFNNRYFAQGR